MSPPLPLPITPTSPSLPSHLTALSLLSLHLANLPTAPSHPARIPLTSKASLVGEITRTDDVLVCLGAGDGEAGGGGEGSLWVKMSAGEAREYVERRKEWVLEREARARDGLPFASLGSAKEKKADEEEKALKPFHPLFLNPALASPSRSQQEAKPAAGAAGEKVRPSPAVEEQKATPELKVEPPTPPKKEAKGKAPASSPSPAVKPSAAVPSRAAPAKSASPAPAAARTAAAGDDLIEIISEGALASGRPSTNANLPGDDTVLNDEGLPIHEIRETLDGQTIGPPPPINEASTGESGIEEGKDTYWSEEAVKRREALRRRIFAEGSDSEEEDAPAAPSPAPAPEAKPTTSAPKPASSPAEPPHGILHHPTSTSTSPSLTPKSILKPPTAQKKSVSFDPSIPASPDSPNPPSTHGSQAQRFGFPLPLAVEDDEPWKPKPVPVLAVPEPGRKGKDKEGDKGFAGLRRGFLGAPPKVQTVKPQDTKPAEATPVAAPAPTPAPAPQKPEEPKPKKKSLFAQRLAHSEIDASAPATSSSTPATASPRIPSLPRASEVTGTSTVKPAVVEKPLPTPASGAGGRGAGPGTVGLKGAVVERDAPALAPVAPAPASEPKSSSIDPTPDGYADEDASEDLSSDDDDVDEFSSGEEDEYDLDDALLAREVALAYHQRRAYVPVNRDPDDPDGDWGEESMGMRGPGGDDSGAGVMLGLPRIGDLQGGQGGEGQGPVIINPTPDDLRRFVRVGRLENGNLVLAPGQEGLSDSSDEEGDGEPVEGEGEEAKEIRERRKEVKRRRDEVRRQLMMGEGEKVEKKKVEPDDRWKSSIPPAVATAVTETPVAEPAPAPTLPKAEESAAKPKKVSRFKAARMAGGQ
ncbi:hypothetical protein IAT38_005225 [Cryptococcus sp. DSM 104549]